MRLTNTIRDAFVRAAMNDVPAIKYEDEAHKLVRDDAIAQLPPKVQAIAKDKALVGYIRTSHHWFGRNSFCSVSVVGPEYKMTEKVAKRVAELVEMHQAQVEVFDGLRSKLNGAAYAVTTRKALAELLPEFEKYLPVDEVTANRSLPVVANIVADFAKAGWPKDAKKAAKKGGAK